MCLPVPGFMYALLPLSVCYLTGSPSTIMCFSSMCQPRGRTSSVASWCSGFSLQEREGVHKSECACFLVMVCEVGL